MKIFFLILFALSGCGREDRAHTHIVETISSRDNQPLWRMRRPEAWGVLPRASLVPDSRIAIKEFGIEDMTLYIHSFPSESEEERIPPIAQVQRWKAQFDSEPECTLTRQAFSGYAGILFDGRGKIKGKDVRMLAWALSLSPKNYAALGSGKNPEIVSDITIKVVHEDPGRHEEDIARAARSFELIEAIP